MGVLGLCQMRSGERERERDLGRETQRLREEYKLYDAGTMSIKSGNVRQQLVIIAIISN